MVIDGYGGSERLQVREIPEPGPPGPGQVLVRVRATSVNPIDWKIRRGSLRFVMPATFPLIPGFDVAGEVAAVGPEVTGFQPGDPVFGGVDIDRHGGACAELVLAREAALAPLPGSLSFEGAAALPTAGLTALQALRDKGELAAGERVAINGASGGVGHLAIQIARALGGRVTGVASARNLDFLRELGAERTIDYEEDDLAAEDDAWEIVFDAAGNRSYRDVEPSLVGDGGIYVTTKVGPDIFGWVAVTTIGGLLGKKKRARIVAVKYRAEDLVHLARLADSGRLRPVLQDVFSLEEIGKAHELSETGQVRGKVGVRIA
ncbi:MAG TPA: NAD(P)-dependent alcohol dehydrogenase [Thermoanaerobaculia bacterium]|nr:NAD(P)-dependent alcohol dehydrogenase [Thermoanaerobaculia bacterium]